MSGSCRGLHKCIGRAYSPRLQSNSQVGSLRLRRAAQPVIPADRLRRPLNSNVGRLPGSQMPQPVEYSEGCKFRSGEANIAGRSPGLNTTSIVSPVQGQPIQSDQRARHASSLGQAVQLRKATRDLVRVTKALRCFSDASRPVRCSVLALSRSHRGRWQPDANSSRLLWALRRPLASATVTPNPSFQRTGFAIR